MSGNLSAVDGNVGGISCYGKWSVALLTSSLELHQCLVGCCGSCIAFYRILLLVKPF